MTEEPIYELGYEFMNLPSHLKNTKQNIAKFFRDHSLHLAYPVLGNLSRIIQERIEKAAGKQRYDAVKASWLTCATNSLIYGALINQMLPSEDIVHTISHYVLGYFPALIECVPRIDEITAKKRHFGQNVPCASLMGKVASLPLEFILGIYDYSRGR